MVFYFVLLGAQRRPAATLSSGVFERFRVLDGAAPTSPPPVGSLGAGPASLEVCEIAVQGVRLFRAIGSGVGADRRDRRLLEDALPVQRTSALLLLAVPCELSWEDLAAFFGTSAMEDVEAFRLFSRDAYPSCSRPSSTSAPFYSVVILCRTQAGADELYKANHGRLFHSSRCAPSSSAPVSGEATVATAAETRGEQASVGPCCYMVFLEAVVYLAMETRSSPPPLSRRGLEDDVPTAAYELPTCPLCLERLDVSGTGMVSHSRGWLSALIYPPAECCRACAAIFCAGSGLAADTAHSGERAPTAAQGVSTVACVVCARQNEIWVCLICGRLGCGRYAAGHAKDHAFEESHRFCLELATGRIWDYSGDVFVHRRLVQLAAAPGGPLFEAFLPAPATDDSAAAAATDVGRPKKTSPQDHEEDLAMQLDAILASQLDHQRLLYEANLKELAETHDKAVDDARERVAAATAARDACSEEIAEAERCRKALERQLLAVRRSRDEALSQLNFVKELNQSLLANRKEIATKGADAPLPQDEEEEVDSHVQRLRLRVEKLMMEISAYDA